MNEQEGSKASPSRDSELGKAPIQLKSGWVGSVLATAKSGFFGADSAMIGNAWESAAAKGFQLAPQIYVLDVAGQEKGLSQKEFTQPLDGLPLQMLFQETATAQTNELSQSWFCETPDRWSWLLVVRAVDRALVGTLTATPPSDCDEAKPLAWQTDGPWQFFEDNVLQPADGQPQQFEVPLTMVAP